uniref:Potassium channel domain-containing protein n=1 Tax=Meloidogyne incognita TaxID=6306 RepID=A0A914MVW0_MELIC
MSTIGFGDITPQHPQYMIMSFFVVIVGLSLVSVCINVVQEKVAQLYMEILNKMLQQYMKACASGDVEALKGAMAGFNSRCKYLMPFISKNQGIRLMSQFKEEARAMGVDLPEVMTELNEETGKPTFCKIFDEKCNSERVNQFLEKANQQSKIKKNTHTQTKQLPLQKAHKFFISRAEEKEEDEQNKELFDNNFGIQCSPLMQDTETEYKLSNEILNEFLVDCSTNTFTVPLRTQGTQPEVSCIMRILEEDDGSSDEIFNYPIEESAEFSSSGLSALNQNYLSGSSKDEELNERKLSISSKRSQQMKRMQEIEVEDYNNLERKDKSLPKVTIHMASTGKGTIDNEDDEDTNLIKKLKQKERKKKMNKDGLRFMRNIAIQTDNLIINQLSSQIGCPLCGLIERGISTENVLIDKSTQFDKINLMEVGVQTEYRRFPFNSHGKKIQTSQQMLISRPAQTQLSSTFQKKSFIGGEEEQENISALEAAAHGSNSQFANIQKEMVELKKAFGLEDEEVNILREKLFKLKTQKQQEKLQKEKTKEGFGPTFSSTSSSDVDGGGYLTREDKLALLNEIKMIKKERKINWKEEEEEEEEESTEVEEVMDVDASNKTKSKGKLKYQTNKDFTLQISQPIEPITQIKNFGRENYEETILDIQLIRSPFFETKYLPQSEERLVFEEICFSCKEPQLKLEERRRIRKYQQDKKVLEEKEGLLLLDKLENLNTIFSVMGESGETATGNNLLKDSTLISSNGNEQMSQFMSETQVQTELFSELDEAMKLIELANLKGINLKELIKIKEELKTDKKWTQTDYNYLELNKQLIDEDKRKKSLMEKIVNLWRGKERKQSTEKEAIIKELKQQKTLELTLSPKTFSKIKKEKEKNEEENIKKDESSKILPLVKKFEKPNINEEKNENVKIKLKKVKPKIEEGRITSSSSTSSKSNNPVVSSGPASLPFDLSDIILITNKQSGLIEAMRRVPQSNITNQQLIPLSSHEWAKLVSLFPELINDKFVGQSSSIKQQSNVLLAKWQKNMIENVKGIKGTKDEKREGEDIKMIPLNEFIATKQNKEMTNFDNIVEYTSWLSTDFGPSTSENLGRENFELEYYRRWLENWLNVDGNLTKLSNFYNVPLRDISEFLNVRREEISQLERQKRQMDRMADLARKEEKTARMVDLSIQTGVLSRVVQTLGEELAQVPESINIVDTLEVDYLTNPAFSIARVPLQMLTMNDDGEEEEEKEI